MKTSFIIFKTLIKGLLIFLPFLLAMKKGFSQEIIKAAPPLIVNDTTPVKDTTAQKDLGDVIGGLFKKKGEKKSPAQTEKVVVSAVAAIGYTLQTKLAATISGNVTFRLHNSSRLSTVSSNATYTQNKQFFWPIQSSIWTKGNKYNFVGDFRYYKYPQSTFGLGSNTPIENEDPMDYTFFRFYEIVMRKISGNLMGGIGFIYDYRTNISHKGNLNGTQSDYVKYGTAFKTVSSGITINALYDTRDNPINASKGQYASLQLRNNLTALGSSANWKSLIIDLRKFVQLPTNSNNVLAFWSYNWLILSGKPPFLDLPSTGWDSYNSTGRGYIQGRYRGAQMVYLESEYRFRISANGLFGGVVFANAESFSGKPGTPMQSIQPGFGTGLRIKIKKTSGTNLAIDYGFGTQGSKGLFISVGEYF